MKNKIYLFKEKYDYEKFFTTHQMGWALSNFRFYEESIELYKKACSIKEEKTTFYNIAYNYIYLYKEDRNKKHLDDALEYIKKCQKLEKDNDYFYSLTVIYYLKGNHKKAYEMMKEYIKNDE